MNRACHPVNGKMPGTRIGGDQKCKHMEPGIDSNDETRPEMALCGRLGVKLQIIVIVIVMIIIIMIIIIIIIIIVMIIIIIIMIIIIIIIVMIIIIIKIIIIIIIIMIETYGALL